MVAHRGWVTYKTKHRQFDPLTVSVLFQACKDSCVVPHSIREVRALRDVFLAILCSNLRATRLIRS